MRFAKGKISERIQQRPPNSVSLRKWRRIGWKNACKLWLEERTPEQLKGEGD
jgi:hypothetical protein